jgi:hypothetical protein
MRVRHVPYKTRDEATALLVANGWFKPEIARLFKNGRIPQPRNRATAMRVLYKAGWSEADIVHVFGVASGTVWWALRPKRRAVYDKTRYANSPRRRQQFREASARYYRRNKQSEGAQA